MIEFCFDEDFFPEVLGGLYPHERYRVFNSIKDLSGESKRNEVFSSFSTTMSGKTMPYGMEPTEVATRMCAQPKITPQFEEFAKNMIWNSIGLRFFQRCRVLYAFNMPSRRLQKFLNWNSPKCSNLTFVLESVNVAANILL